MESSLEVPQARATPQPEQIQPAPPPPKLLSTPSAATAAAGLPPQTAHLPSPPRAAPPADLGSAAYQPPPPVPVLAPLVTPAPQKGAQKPLPAASTPVAEIKFTAASHSLTDQDRQIIEGIVPLYRQGPGRLRIVGYAGAGSGAVEQLDSFRAALDRAQAVAAALTAAGMPADKIQVEAAPETSGSDGRAEVLFER
jgi:outer membrane protein OmpA-like peptidoglycan-associated protein